MENERAAPESRVVILGASNKEDRYSFKAFNFLREREFVPVPVHPRIREVGGVTVFPSLDDPYGKRFDTVTPIKPAIYFSCIPRPNPAGHNESKPDNQSESEVGPQIGK